MSGMFYNTLMCSDSACTRVLFVAEAVGFLGIPLAIGIWCCCNWAKWQAIEEERERKREKLINKTRAINARPEFRDLRWWIALSRSGEPTGQNMRNAPDF